MKQNNLQEVTNKLIALCDAHNEDTIPYVKLTPTCYGVMLQMLPNYDGKLDGYHHPAFYILGYNSPLYTSPLLKEVTQ
jgi:hypothetical protein